MYSEYCKKLDESVGILNKEEKDKIAKAIVSIKKDFENCKMGTIYDEEIRRKAYVIYYGPIYAMQSVVSMCNSITLDYLKKQPDKIFVHGCAHFPESYGLHYLFKLKKWSSVHTQIILLDRQKNWKPWIGKMSLMPNYDFGDMDFLLQKNDALRKYQDSAAPFYIFQNCVNEESNYEAFTDYVLKCYDRAKKGSTFLLSYVLPNDFKKIEICIEKLEKQINSSKQSPSDLKKLKDDRVHYPVYYHESFDFRGLVLREKNERYGNHMIIMSHKMLLGESRTDQYEAKYGVRLKHKMFFKYLIIQK